MKKLSEMNALERKGAKKVLEEEGWVFCDICSPKSTKHSPGWSKGNVCIAEKDLYISELE